MVKNSNIPVKYVPRSLKKKDFIKQKKQILKTRKLYKKGKYITRKKVSSYKSKPSKHLVNVKKIYNIDKLKLNKELQNKTKCKLKSLEKIIKKGQGAYFSSGSRPNQTAHSWGVARLASAITGGKSSVVDYNILEEGCKKSSKALKLAKKAKKTINMTRKIPHLKI
jgi:hypothetical protein